MNRVFLVCGVLIACIGVTMLPAVAVSFWYADGAAQDIAFAALCSVLFGCGLAAFFWKSAVAPITQWQGLVSVGLCWVAAGLFGALPFVFNDSMNLTDAVFESISGFTTTGASVLSNIEALPKGLLFWRSLTHWLGGMGIVVLSLALLPLLGVGGMQLYKAEVSGPNPDRLTPRLHDTAQLLWIVYLGMTVLLALLLRFGGMDWFDAVNHTFATVATGGFSTKNASIAAFPEPFIQWTLIIFMLASGINFTLHLRFLQGRVHAYTANDECRSYLLLLLGSVFCVSLALFFGRTFPLGTFAEWEIMIRTAAFQVVSICTTTGFVTENYSLWPPFALLILVVLTFTGGSAGSTAGGFKIMRLFVLARLASLELLHFLHPRSVRHPKMDGKSLSKSVTDGIVGYLLIFLILLVLFTLLLTVFGVDLATAFTASLTCLSNVGPGLGSVGPVDNFGHLSASVKWLLGIAMLLGRLEIYAILVLFMPEFWKKQVL